MKLAIKGKVINSEFGLGTNKDTILHVWGIPDETDGTSFLNYHEKDVLFSLDAWTDKVDQITTYDRNLQEVTLAELKKIWGKPIEEYDTEGVHMLYYQAGNQQVWIEFPLLSVENSNPTLSSLTIN